MKIGVTGKFGTGKTTFSEFLSKGKIKIISGDELGKELLKENQKEIFAYLNLKHDQNYLERLKESITKDENIFVKYNNWMYTHLPDYIIGICEKYDDVILDAALIFEWQIDYYFDNIILIKDGDFEERFRRVFEKKGGADRELYKLLDRYQWTDEKKTLFCDFLVENNGSLEQLKKSADEIFNKIFSS
uniref:Dephospho-CoA kinase n=1 Tax=candidate division WOR-3 bacterium TaxID=2052148 RepID=A0A7C3NFR9_UNCW3